MTYKEVAKMMKTAGAANSKQDEATAWKKYGTGLVDSPANRQAAYKMYLQHDKNIWPDTAIGAYSVNGPVLKGWTVWGGYKKGLFGDPKQVPWAAALKYFKQMNPGVDPKKLKLGVDYHRGIPEKYR